ncbi:phosphate:acyl-[acyl carrier protein] acyltransferase [Cyclonatronum proteinivorum]|uniref:Phosphate acyltransferase n=1 Tax=Cyclonatronum proteinivorum TaxID=1457365 RepID=A0A345UM33_9BACT|nr:phosphate acyltransferase PlsX [Cyclonatronum proteinivorum]AXJ01535.1 phosphate:acyl-[acyl carrier protein] acyltransferase [Cyclonatronum proteinivorum]
MLKIAIDAVGGDYYPQNPVKGAIMVLEEREDIHIILLGPEELVQNEIAKQGYSGDRLTVVNAPEIIGMDESPSVALKTKKHSSIAIGLTMHAQGKCDAFFSAGNTGALLGASMFILGKIEGVLRPTIGSIYPSIEGNKLMLDVGANIDVKPEALVQFGIMGKVFVENILGIKNPKLGLMNIGEEEEKGREAVRQAYAMLRERDDFVGNIEGRDVMKAKADVYICDGFVGNLLLKLGESIPENILEIIRRSERAKTLSKEELGLIKSVMLDALAPFDYQLIGGVPFLGINGVSMVGHGGSTPLAIKNSILSAEKIVLKKVNEQIKAALN